MTLSLSNLHFIDCYIFLLSGLLINDICMYVGM